MQFNGHNSVTIPCISTKFEVETKIDLQKTLLSSDLTFDKIQDSSGCHFMFLFSVYNLVTIAYIWQKLKVTYRKWFYFQILLSRKSTILDY